MSSIRKGSSIFAFYACVNIVAIYILMMLLSGFVTALLLRDSSLLLTQVFCEGLYALSAVILMKRLGGSLFHQHRSKNPKAVKMIVLFFVISAVLFNLFRVLYCYDGLQPRPIYEILIFAALNLFIGIAEECIFRGIIAEGMIRNFGSDRSGKHTAAFLSGVIFGMVHLINLGNSTLVGVLCQCFAASVMGIFFAEIYYKYRSLWMMIIFHALIDFNALFSYGIYGIDLPAETISSYNPTMLVPYGIAFLVWMINWKRNSIAAVCNKFLQKT